MQVYYLKLILLSVYVTASIANQPQLSKNFTMLRYICICPIPYISFSITELIHDDVVNLQNSTEPSELLIQTLLSTLDVHCQTPLSLNLTRIASENDLQFELSKCNILPIKFVQIIVNHLALPLSSIMDVRDSFYIQMILDRRVLSSWF